MRPPVTDLSETTFKKSQSKYVFQNLTQVTNRSKLASWRNV